MSSTGFYGDAMNLILAADENWAIGNKGNLLCHLSGALKYFKKTTTGHTVIMGRTTLESLPGKKGLPGRKNIVLTTNKDFSAEGVDVVCGSIEELMETVSGDEDVFVIGGAKVYRQLLPFCDTCYITKIYDKFPADAYFVNLDERDEFKVTWEDEIMEDNGIRYRFMKYERK